MPGSWDPEKETKDSNFIDLLRFSCGGKPNIDINEWLSKKYNKFTSPTILNELIQLFGLQTTQAIINKIKNSECRYFSIMADETCDLSTQEQLVICIRWLDEELTPHEEYLAIQVMDDLKAKTISDYILDFLK